MTECDHEHKVCETHLRTALKGITAKVLEIFFDFIVLNLFLHQAGESLGIAIGLEGLCYLLNYLNERGWNKIMWGRKVIEVKKSASK
jgi:hypothetical protein